MSSPASALKKIAKLEAQLNKLKLQLTNPKEPKASKPRTRKDKPESVEACEKKAELTKFTKKELIEWIKNKQITLKKANETLKDDLVKFVWKHLKTESETEAETESESESESESE
jgi:hypothetical protein